MMACESCARMGKPYVEPPRPPPTKPGAISIPTPAVTPRSAPPRLADGRAPREVRELDLADNYPQVIQKGRRKHDLTQEELAMKVKERLSIIQKIELGKMAPDVRLAKTLEHVLRIKLLVPTSEPPAPKLSTTPTKEITFADIARIRKKEEKDTNDPGAQRT